MAEESKDYKKLLQQYLQLTGQIPMIPQWAFGFWMSKCSYMSRKEIEDVVDKAEQLGVGIDVSISMAGRSRIWPVYGNGIPNAFLIPRE